MEIKDFATRAEWIHESNPKKDNKHIIGLDLGYSGAKVFYEDGYFCVPNYATQITGELFGSPRKNDIIYEDIETKKKYFVGEAAIESLETGSIANEEALFGRNHYLSMEFLILARTAVGMCLWDYKTDGHDIVIQTGLPPAYLGDEPYIRRALEGEHIFKLTVGNESRRFHFTIRRENVDVMKQPMGTYYSVVFDRNGKPTQRLTQFMRSNIMIFDGGFVTLDKFIIKNKGRQSQSDTSPKLGMKAVLEEARNLIKRDLGISIPLPAMQNYLKTGFIQKTDLVTLETNEYSIKKYIEQANRIIREEAFDYIRNEIPDTQFLIMTGGTGSAWLEYFQDMTKKLRSMQIIEGNSGSGLPNIYSNARGYYMAQLNGMG